MNYENCFQKQYQNQMVKPILHSGESSEERRKVLGMCVYVFLLLIDLALSQVQRKYRILFQIRHTRNFS